MIKMHSNLQVSADEKYTDIHIQYKLLTSSTEPQQAVLILQTRRDETTSIILVMVQAIL